MKIIHRLLLGFLLLVAVIPQAAAEDWVKLGENDAGTWFIDQHSIKVRKPPSVKSYWIMANPWNPYAVPSNRREIKKLIRRTGHTPYSIKALLRINCDTEFFTVDHVAIYSKTGDLLNWNPRRNRQLYFILPDTVSSMSLKKVCPKHG